MFRNKYRVATQDLYFRESYAWSMTKEDCDALKSAPDDTLFNRADGWHVLYIINELCRRKKINDKTAVWDLELIIRSALPPHLRTQKGVMQWLEESFE